MLDILLFSLSFLLRKLNFSKHYSSNLYRTPPPPQQNLGFLSVWGFLKTTHIVAFRLRVPFKARLTGLWRSVYWYKSFPSLSLPFELKQGKVIRVYCACTCIHELMNWTKDPFVPCHNSIIPVTHETLLYMSAWIGWVLDEPHGTCARTHKSETLFFLSFLFVQLFFSFW